MKSGKGSIVTGSLEVCPLPEFTGEVEVDYASGRDNNQNGVPHEVVALPIGQLLLHIGIGANVFDHIPDDAKRSQISCDC